MIAAVIRFSVNRRTYQLPSPFSLLSKISRTQCYSYEHEIDRVLNKGTHAIEG